MTTLTHCPHCGGSLAPPRSLDELTAELRHWCAQMSIPIFPGDLVREHDAARAIDREPKTLRNWRAISDPRLPSIKRNGRRYYALQDLAKYRAA